MKRTIAFLLGAAALVAASNAAQAVTISASNEVLDNWYSADNVTKPDYAHKLADFDGRGLNGTILTTKGKHPNSVSLTGTGTGGINAVLTGDNARIVSGNNNTSSFNSTKPFNDNTNYLAVDSGGQAIFTLSKPAHYFGFEWGSVDTFNTVQFFDGDKLLATLTGKDVTTHGGTTGDLDTYYANFTSNLPITKVVMKSNGNAFEVDNVYVSSVPIPAALPLFGAAVAGLGAMGKRRRRKAAAAGVTMTA